MILVIIIGELFMKAAVVSEFKGPLVIKDIPLPNVKPRDVLVKVHACGVCHTDLHACHGDYR